MIPTGLFRPTPIAWAFGALIGLGILCPTSVHPQTMYQPTGAVLNGPSFCFQIASAAGFQPDRAQGEQLKVPYFSTGSRQENSHEVLFVRVVPKVPPITGTAALVEVTASKMHALDHGAEHQRMDRFPTQTASQRPLNLYRYQYSDKGALQIHRVAYVEEDENIIALVHMSTTVDDAPAVAALGDMLAGYRYFGNGCRVTVVD